MAKAIVDSATSEDAAATSEAEVETDADTQPEKNPAAVALGRLGGKKGGKARALRLSAERRSEIARDAARARWAHRADD